LQHLHFPDLFTNAEYARRQRSYRTLCDNAAIVVVHCEAVRNDLIRWYEIPKEQIAVVPMASVFSLGAPLHPVEAARRRERLALPQRYALFPAQSWPHKNHLRMVTALQLLRGRGLEIPVVCPGATNSNLAAIRAAAAEAGVSGLLRFPGHVTTDDLRAMYAGAALLIFPSLHEGFGLPVIEALDTGLPVVCSRIDALVELAQDAAQYLDPSSSESIADALASVWSDDGTACRLARLARERATQFSWATTARAYRSLYKRVDAARAVV
jgi:glycosyltransferase involved in cell wall biosynthesis